MEKKDGKLKLTLLLVSSLTILSIITISPAIPQMAKVFSHEKNAELLVKLVLTFPALMIALVSPYAGRLIDRYGRLRPLYAALVVYAVAGVGGYFLQNLYAILLSRAVLGMAVGVSMTIVVTLIADYFEGAQRQKFVGVQIAFMSLGGIVFISLGGILSDSNWRSPFLLYLSSLVILPLAVLFLPEPQPTQKQFHATKNIRPPAFIWMLFLNTMLMWIVFFLIPVQVPFYLKALGVDKNAFIGAAIAMSTIFSAVSSFFYSRIRERFNFLSVFSIGYLLMAAGFVCMAMAGSYLSVVIAMMFAGLGMGMMIPNTNMWVMKIAPPQTRGREIGKLTTFWFLGQFLSPILIFPVLHVLSLSSTFLVASGFLLFVSLTFLLFHFSKRGRAMAG